MHFTFNLSVTLTERLYYSSKEIFRLQDLTTKILGPMTAALTSEFSVLQVPAKLK